MGNAEYVVNYYKNFNIRPCSSIFYVSDKFINKLSQIIQKSSESQTTTAPTTTSSTEEVENSSTNHHETTEVKSMHHHLESNIYDSDKDIYRSHSE